MRRRSLIAFEAALEDGTAAGDAGRQRVVAGYNEDDCRATLALRDWLEERRAELAARLGVLTCPGRLSPSRSGTRPRTRRSSGSGPRCWPASRRSGRRARRSRRREALLADLLEWHRREDKPAWWRYFYVRTPRALRS